MEYKFVAVLAPNWRVTRGMLLWQCLSSAQAKHSTSMFPSTWHSTQCVSFLHSSYREIGSTAITNKLLCIGYGEMHLFNFCSLVALFTWASANMLRLSYKLQHAAHWINLLLAHIRCWDRYGLKRSRCTLLRWYANSQHCCYSANWMSMATEVTANTLLRHMNALLGTVA